MAGKGTRHRFELSRLEIAGVLVSATAGLFVVFLLGIYAGRGLAERRGDEGQQIVRMAIAPAAEQTPGAEDGLTFYDTLGGGRGAKGEGHGAERPAVAPALEDVPAPPPPHEHAKPAESVPVAEPEPEPTVKGEKAEKAEKAEKSEKAEVAAKAPEPPPQIAKREPAPASTPGRAARSPTPPSTARVAVALAPATAPTPVTRTGAKGDWSVQVSATRDPRTADGVLRRLKGKGYDAFVLKVRRRGETFYRVRVGHYASLEEAQQVVSRLRREPGVPEAFVASD
jgi:cell division septation protein DedD